jgi:signal transduction histidine kinase
MALMILVFGIMLTANYVYNEYWNDVDTLQVLEWFADSGVFLGDNVSAGNGYITEEDQEEDNPIIGLIVDSEGNVLSRKMIGNASESDISEKMVRNILSQESDQWKCGSYIYSKKRLEDGTILIVLMNSIYHNDQIVRIGMDVLLITGGILLLTLITFYLSRYVTDPARKALEREKQFVSDASHELKTPLGAISINVQALAIDDSENIYVKNIVSETNRMNCLVERLLILSRLEESRLITKKVFSLSDVIEEMTLTYESVAYDKRIKYHFDIGERVMLNGDEDEIRQLAVILLDNAIKNTLELGSIHVSLQRKREQIIMEVKNTGEGILPEALPHIFERFYSTDTSRNNNSFGLGLAIAKAIVERHNGVITVASEPEKETLFTVIFKE